MLRFVNGVTSCAFLTVAARSESDTRRHSFGRRADPGILRQRRAQADFWGWIGKAVRLDAALATRLRQGFVRAQQSSSRVQLRRAALVARQHRIPPRRLAMNLEHLPSEAALNRTLRDEARAFELVCRGRSEAAKLPDALRAARDLENTTAWLLPWATDRVSLFGLPSNLSAGDYGVTWFSSWQAVVARPSVADALRLGDDHYPNTTSSTPDVLGLVVVVGGALGCQCLFALALGARRCVAYEVLCTGMVVPARRLVESFGLSDRVEIRCEDARRLPHLDAFKQASLLWLNDQSFPLDLRRDLQRIASKTLPLGSAVVVYAPPVDAAWRAATLPRQDEIRVHVSWSFVARLTILKRHGDGAAPLTAPPRILSATWTD